MKKLLLAFTMLLAASAAAYPQATVRVNTSPKLPMREALERMNLVSAWNARVTVEGNRDGIFSVQFLPGTINQLVVQTYRGMVFLYDADQGNLLWKTQVGEAYWAAQPAAFNSHSIFVTRRNVLHVLNRKTGAQRVYTYEERTKQAEFGYPLAYTPNASPVADEGFLYVTMGDRVGALSIPNFELIAKLKQEEERRRRDGKGVKPQPSGEDPPVEDLDSPQPDFYWSYRFADQLTISSPLVFGDQVSILTTDGTLTSVDRTERGPRKENFEFKMTGKAAGAAGQYLNMAFLGSDDFNLYAIDMNTGRLVWRYVSGAPIRHAPVVNDSGLFVAPERAGMRRIDLRGRDVWDKPNRDTSRFLANNHVNVYALDHIGRFYVLDGRRGTTLATHNLSDWTISVANEWTDRIYLAANDGQILCLRHRDLLKPMVLKTLDLPKAPEKKKPMEEKKDVEEKAARLGRAPTPDHAFKLADGRLSSPRASAFPIAFEERRTWAWR